MRFLNGDYNIKICKFKKDDLVLRSNFIYVIGKTNQPGLEIRYNKNYIPKQQLAEYGEYIYIPEDQLDNNELYNWPKPVKTQILTKFDWLNLKEKYPYIGEK